MAVYHHCSRVQPAADSRIKVKNDVTVELAKSDILLIGPTGCGKKLLAQKPARGLIFAFAIADAPAFAETGRVDELVENILLKLTQAAAKRCSSP